MTELQSLVAQRFSVVDVETSGLNARRNRILQIGLVTCTADGTIDSSWSTFVRPRWWRVARVGPTWLHGIRRADLRHAPRPSAALSELADRLAGSVIVAHNMRFDWEFLSAAAKRNRVTLPSTPRLCTLQLSRSLDPERLVSHRLADICSRYGIDHSQPHHALSDAAATASVLGRLLREASVDTAEALAQVTLKQRRNA